MTRTLRRSSLLATLALAVGAYAPALLHAQDRPDQKRDQPSASQQEQRSDEHGATQNERGTRQSTHAVNRHQQRGGDENRASRDEGGASREEGHDNRGHEAGAHETGARDDDAEQLRRAHPRAAARCHDGFFTNTRTRARACSKHGGIDIWLLP